MNLRTPAMCVAAALWCAAPGLAQHSDRHDHDNGMSQPADAPSFDEMMAEWMKYAEPAEHHRLLQPMIGDWHVMGKMWMDPSQSEPTVMHGEAHHEWVLGGRFMLIKYKSEFMGMPFEGMGMNGYDRYLQQYQSFWWDTFGTMTYQSVGTVSPDGKVFTYQGAMQDPAMGGALKKTKDVIRIISNDKHVMQMHHQMPDGSWMKVMELTYTRK
ncbi:MAG: DUF1579 domain-containing protein [Planctomycetota bacterium]|nr:MAG: DUF1579 domain-containing protein [Planctomycetota bacterium]